MKTTLLNIISLLVFVSCTNTGVKQQLRILQSKPIELCSECKVTMRGADTLYNDYHNANYKMVIYTDSTSCSSCALSKLYLWENLIEWSEQYDGALKYYFIFSPPKGENIRLALRNSMLDYPMLLDSLGEFERLNPHLPKNKAMHTFLLNENNNAVLVGNPINNPKIEKIAERDILSGSDKNIIKHPKSDYKTL